MAVQPQSKPRNDLAHGWRVSLRARGVAVLAVPLAALFAALFSIYWVEGDVRDADLTVMRAYAMRAGLVELRSSLLDAQTAVSGYLATTEPQFLAVYEFGGVLLPSIDKEEAIRLLKKGIAANPNEWRLYHLLGYIYWQSNQFPEAAEIYQRGAKAPGAPAWMEALAARMNADGGSRGTAREMYQQVYRESEDPNIREMAHSRLLQLQSFDERDVIRKVLSAFSARAGRCPQTWREVSDPLRRSGLPVDLQSGEPLDPAGFPYLLTQNGCEVDLHRKSQVPYR